MAAAHIAGAETEREFRYMTQKNDPLTKFPGRYSVNREIDDQLTGEVVGFVGIATLERLDPHRALYEETGELIKLSGARFQAQRRYSWEVQGLLIAVRFDDGGAFHTFDPVHGGAAQEHICGDDLYKGGYEFADWPDWTLRWTVTGPRKDYRSVTHYRKIL